MQKHKKVLYRETEDKLFKYFNRDRIATGLNSQLKTLNIQIERIEKELKEGSYINIEEQSSSPGFEERVQTSSTGISYAESQVMKLTDIKISRKDKLEIDREYIINQLDDLECIKSEMGWKVDQLSNNYKKMLDLIYKENMNEVQISFKLHLSQSQVNKRKNKILEQIFMWEKWS
jgi:DNA-directed RNA polymerase specialized sigma subunit